MELTYPINFVGYERGDNSGEVNSRDGEYLGTWILFKDDGEVSGELRFIVEGESEPLFSEVIGTFDSGLRRGSALSMICQSIRTWHEEKA